jgi:hypothetical protein
MNKKDQQILKDSALVVADGIASLIPGLIIAWGLSKSLYGASLKLREQRALEWVEMVRDNPVIFGEEILESENFQDAFVYSFEKYISERNEEKRKLIKKVFLGYSSSEDMEQFEIERFYSAISSISLSTISYLDMLGRIIPQYFDAEKNIFEEEKYRGKKMGWAEYCKDGWTYLTKYTQQYIHEEFDPNSTKVKERYHYDSKTDSDNKLIDKIYSIKKTEERKHDEAVAELISLGILIPRVEGGGGIGGGGGNFEANLTNFGFRFFIFLIS